MKEGFKYLITGGAGFIGSNFVHLLFRQYPKAQVCVLDKMEYSASIENLRPFLKLANFKFIVGDICDKRIVQKAMDGAQVIVNFAAQVAVDRSIRDPQSFLKTDVLGVYTLLEEARKLKSLKRFVQISTDEVYGHILRGSFKETSLTNPRNPYSASKLAGERIAYSFFETYQLPVIITRASNTYGPRAYPEKVIPLFITNLYDGLPVPVYGNGSQIRDWLYVEDHCQAIDLLIHKGVNGQVYNVGAKEEITNLGLTKKILKLMDQKGSSIRFVCDRPGHDQRYSLSCKKIANLGWCAQVTLDQGLQKTVAWYKEHEQWWRPLKKKLDKRFVKGYWNTDKKSEG